MSTLQSARADIIRLLNETEELTVISHYNPDADAYGSALGLALSLQAAGKRITVVNESETIDRYRSIPGISQVINKLPDTLGTIVVCDCGALSRIGDSLVGRLKGHNSVINIDHHVSNDAFGSINLIDVDSSSTSEIIYDLLTEAPFPVTNEVAGCLLGGIIGDTGSFRYSCTSAKTFRVAAHLVDKGASPTGIFQSLFGSSPLSAIKLQSEAMLTLQQSFDGRFVEVIVTAEMIKKHNATLEDTDGLAEKARDIEGVKISAAIREDGHIWRISLRSVSPEFNVSDIAASFGGGGHKQAAAFRSSKSLEQIRGLLSSKIGAVLI